MKNVRIWKVLGNGEVKEVGLTNKASPLKPVFFRDTDEAMCELKRLLAAPEDLLAFIENEWKFLFYRGLLLVPDDHRWGTVDPPHIESVELASVFFGQIQNIHHAPEGQPKNWHRLRTLPLWFLGYRVTIDIRLGKNLMFPISNMFHGTNLNVVTARSEFITNTGRAKQTIRVEFALFLDDWEELAKTTMMSRLAGDDPLVSAYYRD